MIFLPLESNHPIHMWYTLRALKSAHKLEQISIPILSQADEQFNAVSNHYCRVEEKSRILYILHPESRWMEAPPEINCRIWEKKYLQAWLGAFTVFLTQHVNVLKRILRTYSRQALVTCQKILPPPPPLSQWLDMYDIIDYQTIWGTQNFWASLHFLLAQLPLLNWPNATGFRADK